MKNYARRMWRILVLIMVLVTFVFPADLAQAAPAGFSEYYIPGTTDQLFQILKDIDNDPDLGNALGGGGTCTAAPCNHMHNVITVSVSADNTTVYYDHWENGYGTGSVGADEVYVMHKGDVLTFESSNIRVPRNGADACTSTNPNGTTTACYDGRDRLYVAGGAVSVAEAFWPEVTGTVFANAWEVYPVKPYQPNYTIPVGEDLSGAPLNYTDFNQVFVIAQATQDNTTIQIDNPATAGVEVNVTLNRGQTAQLFHVNAGTTVTGSAPLQVQFIVGQPNPGLSSDSRSYTAVPSTLWEFEYYGPVPSFGGGSNTDVFIYNPTNAPLSINYQDNLGSGTFILPSGTARSYQTLVGRFVPANSALYLAASDGNTHFWAIGSANSENADFNYGFTLIPTTTLTREYYIGWAPGNMDLSDNGSPVFVTPIADNTTVFVDYSPTDGVIDVTFTLNRIQMQRVFDPDNNNTGMHIWATNPIAVVWGEDALAAQPGNPFIDAGYSILPLNQAWIDTVLTLDKSADPSVIASAIGQISTFTLITKTETIGLQAVSVLDTLPPGWGYVAGSSIITLPDGTTMTGASADPMITSQNLTWNKFPLNPLDMNSNETLTIKFQGITTTVPVADVFVNEATATGTNGTETFSASDTAMVYVSDLLIDKTSSAGGTTNPGDPVTYTVNIRNNGKVTHNNIVVIDPLPVGTTYTSQSTLATGFLSETVGDAFNTITYTGDQDSNGTTSAPSWIGDWAEVGEADGANAGDVQVLTDLSNYQLRIQNNNHGVLRDVDLSACTTATLSLDYRRNALDTNTDLVQLGIGKSGMLTDTIINLAGPNNDATYQTYSADITNWISPQTRIQLRSSATLGAADQIFFDNILITCFLPTIKDNIPAASNPDLISGTPATLITSADSFDLAPGATMNVSYQVLINNPIPVGQTNVVNLVSVTSDEQPDPLKDSVIDVLPTVTPLPLLSVNKAAFPNSVPATGGSVTFTYTVTNTGPVNVEITGLTDNRFGTMSGDADCQVGTILTPAASCSFRFTTKLSGTAGTSHVNVFTANAVDANNNAVSDDDNATVSFTPDIVDPPTPPAQPTPKAVVAPDPAISSFLIPVTGFAPNIITDLSQSPRVVYADTAITLEIPALAVNIPIVGVPHKDGAWNVDWLGNQAGWLEGSAFPAWNGNSVLTGHVYLSSGKPGPFVNLHELKYSDQIIVHAYGQKYIFEVRTHAVIAPNDKSVMKHEEKPWLTLVTCMNYDEKTGTYKNRFVVRSVLMKVAEDK